MTKQNKLNLFFGAILVFAFALGCSGGGQLGASEEPDQMSEATRIAGLEKRLAFANFVI